MELRVECLTSMPKEKALDLKSETQRDSHMKDCTKAFQKLHHHVSVDLRNVVLGNFC